MVVLGNNSPCKAPSPSLPACCFVNENQCHMLFFCVEASNTTQGWDLFAMAMISIECKHDTSWWGMPIDINKSIWLLENEHKGITGGEVSEGLNSRCTLQPIAYSTKYNPYTVFIYLLHCSSMAEITCLVPRD